MLRNDASHNLSDEDDVFSSWLMVAPGHTEDCVQSFSILLLLLANRICPSCLRSNSTHATYFGLSGEMVPVPVGKVDHRSFLVVIQFD